MSQGEVRIVLVQRNNDEFTKLCEMTVSDQLPIWDLRKMAKEKTGWEWVRLRERRGTKGRFQFVFFLFWSLIL